MIDVMLSLDHFRAHAPRPLGRWLFNNEPRVKAAFAHARNAIVEEAVRAAQAVPRRSPAPRAAGEAGSRVVLDVSNGIVLRETERADAPVVKGAPVRFQWSSREGFWYVARSKDRAVDEHQVARIVAYFAQAGLPVRVERGEGAAPGVAGLSEVAAIDAERAGGAAEATGPSLRSVLTSTGQLASAAWELPDPPYVQQYEADAKTALSFMPPGIRIERRNSSRYGQVFVFFDRAEHLVTKGDFERYGGPEKAAALVAAQQADVEAEVAAAIGKRQESEAQLLAAARAWTDKFGRKVWQVDDRLYKIMEGIHIPWICEISPSEYGSLSKRGKARYDEKRRQEWGASGEASQRWAHMVHALARAGDITTATEGISDAAQGQVYSALSGHAAQEQATAARQAEREAKGALRAASAPLHTESKMAARDRASEIMNLVSRGVKRETGATAMRSGIIGYPGGGLPGLRVGSRDWVISPNAYYNEARTPDGGILTTRKGSFTDADSAESVAEAIFAALRDMFPRPPAEQDYPAYAKKNARKVFGASGAKGTATAIVLTIPTRHADVELELTSPVAGGYKLWRAPYYSHHEKRVPIAVAASGSPAEALAAVARVGLPWAAKYAELRAVEQDVYDRKIVMSYHAEPEAWKALNNEYERVKAERAAMGG